MMTDMTLTNIDLELVAVIINAVLLLGFGLAMVSADQRRPGNAGAANPHVS